HFGPWWYRSCRAGITTPSSWTARAGWPTPRRPWPAMRTTANPARCSPSEVARDAHLHACGAPVARGHGGRGTDDRPANRFAPRAAARRHAADRCGARRFGAHRHAPHGATRSEEHTSELQSPDHLVCRLLLEKKKKQNINL